MQDPLDAYQQAFTCPFCQSMFSQVVIFIPDCGNFICGACYDDLIKALGETRKYECEACGDNHVLPENGLVACKKLTGFLRQPLEKPLSDEAKRLKQLIENVQEELVRLQAFDPRDHIEHTYVQLELEVSQTAESAVTHIKQIETELLHRIRAYRQRCLDQLAATALGSSTQPLINQMSTATALAQEIGEFSTKWNDHFNRLNSLASESQVDDAIHQTSAFQVRMKQLDQEIKNRALGDTHMQFQPCESFCFIQTHLGELVELTTNDQFKQNIQNEVIRIQETPSSALASHSGSIQQAVFLPGNRLASCSSDESITVWDTASGTELFTLKAHTSVVCSLAILSNGWLASGSTDTTIKVWDLVAKREMRTLTGHRSSIASLTVLKNGNLVSYSTDDTIKIWNPYLNENNLLQTITGHGNKKWIIPLGVLSNDFLVSLSRSSEDIKEENTLRVWNPNDGQLVKSLSTGLKLVCSVLVLSNDLVAIGTDDGTIKIIDLEDQSKTRTIERAHMGCVSCLLKLPNGNLVSGGEDRKSLIVIDSIKVWDVSGLTLLQHIKTVHTDTILSLSVSKNGRMLASGSKDKTIQLWPINIIKNDETNS